MDYKFIIFDIRGNMISVIVISARIPEYSEVLFFDFEQMKLYFIAKKSHSTKIYTNYSLCKMKFIDKIAPLTNLRQLIYNFNLIQLFIK